MDGLPLFYQDAFSLRKGVLGLVKHALGLVEADVLHAQQLEQLEQRLAVMAEGHRPVVGIALLDEHMAVEAAHLRDGEHADAPKEQVGTGSTSPSAT